jgi:CHAD domain-containing protein
VGVALRRALGAQLARIREHDPEARAGDDPEALHQQRVGARRARAVLRAYGDALPPRRRAWLQRELRWLGGVLGTVRDLDVQLEGCLRLQRGLPAAEASALTTHVTELQAERVRKRSRMLVALDSPRYFQLLCELEMLGSEREVHGDGPAAARLLAAHGLTRADHALRTLRQRGKKLAHHASKASADELHALRIRARRTRYLIEVLSALTGAPGRRVLEHLVRIQDALGAHQDAVVAAAAIAAHQTRLAAEGKRNTRRGLATLAAAERRRAQRARRDFARAFVSFDRKWRDVERMCARLAAVEPAPTGDSR